MNIKPYWQHKNTKNIPPTFQIVHLFTMRMRQESRLQACTDHYQTKIM